MATTRVNTVFRPGLHGFHFRNTFNASLADILFNQSRCEEVTAIILTGGLAALTWPTRIEHLCGGMCWAALDRYFGHTANPVPADTTPPAVNTPLFLEIFGRQVDTLAAHGSLPERFCDWMNRPDRGHVFDRTSIGHLVQSEEWPALKGWLDRGIPVSLAVVRERGLVEGGGIKVWDNHQVLAWGYSYNDQTKRVEICIYDPNYPDADDVTLGITLGQSKSRLSATHSCGDPLRGFFCWDYDRPMVYVSPADPRRSRARALGLEWLLLSGPGTI
jgi:hypothetical protein